MRKAAALLGTVDALVHVPLSKLDTRPVQEFHGPVSLDRIMELGNSWLQAEHSRLIDKYTEHFAKPEPAEVAMQAAKGKLIHDNILNLHNAAYLGELFFGTPGQRAYVVFDTGSNWVTVTSTDCLDCDVTYYNATESSTMSVADLETKTLTYGSATLEGVPLKDRICLKDPEDYSAGHPDPTCLKDFKFLNIAIEEGLTHEGSLVGGILGLGPDVDQGPSFLLGLKDQGLIDNAVLGFNLGLNQSSALQQSTMTFGGYDEDMTAGEEHITMDLVVDMYWGLDVRRVRYGKHILRKYQAVDESMVSENGVAIGVLDTGTSTLAMPQAIVKFLVEQWKEQVGSQVINDQTCQANSICIALTSCEELKSKVEPITIQLKEHEFVLDPKAFLVDGGALSEEVAGYCLFGLIPTPRVVSKDMFILGDVFIRSFYTIFDFENKQLQLTVNKNAKDMARIQDPESLSPFVLRYLIVAAIYTAATVGIVVAIANMNLKQMKVKVQATYANKQIGQ